MPALDLLRGLGHRAEAGLEQSVERVTEHVGGPARRRVIVLLALVLSVDAADKGAVAALAFDLERGLHIGNMQVGLMVTVTSLVGALATVPFGQLADRSRRVRLLWIGIIFWASAQALSGLAPTYAVLIAIRVALGGVTALAGPVVASLTGDLFPPEERGRMWGFILTGEVLGTGAGVLVSGLVSNWFGWRAAFVVLAVPSLALAWALRRWLPEPARGGQSRLEEGATEILPVEEAPEGRQAVAPEPTTAPRDAPVRRFIRRHGVAPSPAIVLEHDPADMTIWAALLYVLRVRTNLVLIVASSLGYFFFSGLSTFAVIYVRGQYGLGQGTASLVIVVVGLGIVAGLVVAGRLGDNLLRRGRVDSRLLVGVVGFVGAALVLAPALATSSLAIALPLFVVAGALVSAPNPGLDAARLDVVPARMWGRAEAARTVLRQTLEAFAPLIFGVVSEVFGGGVAGLGSGVDLKHSVVSHAQTHALQWTFLVMLVPVAAGGLILLLGRRSYPVDVASAMESDVRIARSATGDGSGARRVAGPAGARPG